MKDELIDLIESQERKWLDCLDKASKFLRNAPKGNVKTTLCHGKYSQYYYSEKNDEPPKKYAGIRKRPLVRQLIQRDYCQQVIDLLDPALRKLQAFKEWYDPDIISRLYSGLPEGRQKYITPVELSDEEYIKQWMSEKPSQRPGYEIGNDLMSNKGEAVRSKSEKIAVDILYRLGIPYVYEAPLKLPGFGLIYPDFTMLNVRLRKTFYYEHFGLMDDPVYAARTFKKIAAYEEAGFWFGDGLLYTFEFEKIGLNTPLLEKMMRKYLL